MRRPTELNRAFATARSAVSVSEDTGEAYEAPGILMRGTRAGAARGEVWACDEPDRVFPKSEAIRPAGLHAHSIC